MQGKPSWARATHSTAAESVLDTSLMQEKSGKSNRIGMGGAAIAATMVKVHDFAQLFERKRAKQRKILKEAESIANNYCFCSTVLGVLDVSFLQRSWRSRVIG